MLLSNRVYLLVQLISVLFATVLSVEVRLNGAGTPESGRVEVYYKGVWGTVCDDLWDINDAHVVCRMLGFPKALHAHSNAKYGQGTGLTWLDNIRCNGNETSIANCLSNPWGDENCGHSEDAGVVCLITDKIRLNGNEDPGIGRVEVYHNGTWGTVCDDGWDINDGHVVCRMLGYTHALKVTTNAKHGEGTGKIWLDDVQCKGNEYNLSLCTHKPWGSHNCGHSEDAGVVCSTTKVRLVGTGAPGSGRVEVYYNESWGTVCDDSWDINDAHVVCRMLGFPEALKATTNAKYGQGTGKIWLDNVQCIGNENSLSLCSHSSWGSHNCDHSEDAGVVCSTTKVRLNGTGGLTSGRVEVYYNGLWGTVCDNSWDVYDAHVTCRMLEFPSALKANTNAKNGQGTGMIWLDKVQCSGDEKSLFHCSHSQWGQHNCKHSNDAGVECLNSTIEIRLVDSTKPNSGRIEVKFKGTWSSVCSDSWDIRDAEVACRMLGYTDAFQALSLPSNSKGGRRTLWADTLNCTGDENNLAWCPHIRGWGEHKCSNLEDAGVVCSNTTVRLRGSDVQGSGRVEVYYNGTWGTICDNYWDIRDAHVVCRMLGYTHALQANKYGKYGQGKGKIWLDRVMCTGKETNLFNCTHREWGENSCHHREDAGVMCANTSARLQGGVSQLEGRLEIYHERAWRSVCTKHWTLKEAHVACRMMGYHSALYARTIYGSFDSQVGIKDLRCNGSENSLVECRNNGWNLQDCPDKKYAFVICSLDIRLKAGNSTTDGRVEIFFNGLWGTVCATNWDLKDAEVVCQMLGYGHALQATSVKRHAGDKTPIWLDSVQCRGIERNIESCSSGGLSVTQCSHKMEAWVTCKALGPEDEVSSTWSQWSLCSASCGIGWQVRTRVCKKSCDERSSTESRNCTTASCIGSGNKSTGKIQLDQTSYQVIVPLLSVFCLLLLGVIIALVYRQRRCQSKHPELGTVNTTDCRDEEQPPEPEAHNDYEDVVCKQRTMTAESNKYDQPFHPPRPSTSSGYQQPQTKETNRKPAQKAAKHCGSTYSSPKQHDDGVASCPDKHIYMALLKTNRPGNASGKMKDKKPSQT